VIAPETDLERRLLEDARLAEGLAWGSPRWGHPEGSVGAHVGAILECIDPADPLRGDLRVVAMIHDAFKREVRPDLPWSPENDHAVLARRFAERHIDDERILATIELHDEPYWVWRHDGELGAVLARVPDLVLFAAFVELDASTEGKDLSFLWWFRRTLAIAGVLPAHARLPVLETGDGETVAYVKTFAVDPEEQAVIERAVRALVTDHAVMMEADGEVLVSADGLRVQLVWRWRGAVEARLLREGDLVRQALAAHPELARARALDARLYRS
jgi:hypothetical protein